MSFDNTKCSPLVIIDDHFEATVREIDVATNFLINQAQCNTKINILKQTRQKQIEKVKEIKEINLKPFENFNETAYLEKWNHVINNSSLDYKKKCDLIKEEIICIDCVLLKESMFHNEIDLWVMASFQNEMNAEFLKYINTK